MGTLGYKGAKALLNCPAVNQLDTLNIGFEYLAENMIQRLQLIADTEKDYIIWEAEGYVAERYCAVAE